MRQSIMLLVLGRGIDVKVVYLLETSNSVEALVGVAYERRVIWRTVNICGGMNDKVTYRTLYIRTELGKRLRSMRRNVCKRF